MTHTINLPADNLDDWLNELKPYQRDIIKNLLKTEHQNTEKTAEKWLTMTGSSNIAAFGGIENPKPFWDSFKNEIYLFFCDDTAYADIKKSFGDERPIVKKVLISAVSGAIGATLGYSATLLAPAVVLMLSTIAQMGINAYCKTKTSDDKTLK